jgi:Condensation domain
MRQLGANERITWSYQQLRPMQFAIVVSMIGKISLKELERALTKAQKRHPLLNVKIALDKLQSPWFVEDLVQIPIRTIQRENTEHWKREVQEELLAPFDHSKAPLIRVCFIQGNEAFELILICDHTIADGRSVLFLLRDILQYIGAPNQPVITLPLRESYEKLAHKTTYFEVPELEAEAKESKTLPKNSCPRIQVWVISVLQTKAIIDKCKDERTTVHGAICAAFMLATGFIKCLTPVDIRGMLPEIEDDFGYYFTAVTTSHSITPDLSIWDLARSVKSQLNEEIAPSRIFGNHPELDAFLSTSPSHIKVVEMLDLVNAHDILISNLGQLDMPEEYGKLKLTSVYGPSLMSHMAQDLIVGVVTFGGKMHFSLTYDEMYFSHLEIERLQQKTVQLLLCEDSLTG